jgi:hypothetical protein
MSARKELFSESYACGHGRYYLHSADNIANQNLPSENM